MKLALVELSGANLVYEKKHLKKVLRAAGNEIAGIARKLISQKSGAGRRYSRLGKTWTASAAGAPPVSVTGALLRGIKVTVFRSGEGVSIRDTTFYSLFMWTGAKGGGGNTRNRKNILLAGEKNWRGKVLRTSNRMKAGSIDKARVMEPRPFLSTALEMRRESIAPRHRESLVDDIAFRRIKP